MRRLLSVIVTLSLALWLGGLAALFLFVQRLFTVDRSVAVDAAPILFRSFEIYQLIVFVVAMVSCAMWRMFGRSKYKSAVVALVLLAGVGAIVQTTWISSRMREMTDRKATDNAEFRSLHGYSMIVYTGATVLLTAAALILPAAIRSDLRPAAPPKSGT